MAGETILVVDDNAINLRLASFVLVTTGYRVRNAVNAKEALAEVETHRPQLILMDIQLPGIDGLELTRRLKADPATRDIIIVALTAFAMMGDEQKALEAGCDAYITKPIDRQALRTKVAELLEPH